MRRLPAVYVVTLGSLLLIAGFTLVVSFGVPPFDGWQTFLLSQVVGAFTLLVFGVVGGAFVGMLLAHRMLASREFTPFERATLESLEEIGARLRRLEARAGIEEPVEETLRR
jgi:MFS superfamily sulfate permease-like transporter